MRVEGLKVRVYSLRRLPLGVRIELGIRVRVGLGIKVQCRVQGGLHTRQDSSPPRLLNTGHAAR